MGKLCGKSAFFKEGPPAKIGQAHQPIVQFLTKNIKGKTVLDLGGGEGAYAYELQKNGFSTTVAEINQEALDAAAKHGLNTQLVAENEDFGENIADTVMMIEVLEHVPNPKEFLENAIKAAKKRVLITLPCTDEFEELFQFGLTYAHIAVTDHLNHYSEKELHELFGQVASKFTITKGDPLYLTYITLMFKKHLPKRLASFCLFPIKVLRKYDKIQDRAYSRFYCIIEVE